MDAINIFVFCFMATIAGFGMHYKVYGVALYFSLLCLGFALDKFVS